MSNYAKNVPRDVGGAAMTAMPAPYISNEQYTTENGVNSSVISLQPTTTTLEVGAFGGQGAFIRWIPIGETATQAPFGSVISSGLGANYDHYIPPSAVRRFVVPKETQGSGLQGGQTGSVNGLYQRVARINAGTTASSVLVIEY